MRIADQCLGPILDYTKVFSEYMLHVFLTGINIILDHGCLRLRRSVPSS